MQTSLFHWIALVYLVPISWTWVSKNVLSSPVYLPAVEAIPSGARMFLLAQAPYWKKKIPFKVTGALLERRSITFTSNVKQQTRRCTTWPSFPITCRLLFIISRDKLVDSRNFLSIRILLSCFYLFIFYVEKFSTWIWRLPFSLFCQCCPAFQQCQPWIATGR